MALKAKVTSVQIGRDSPNVGFEIFDDADPSTILENGTASVNTKADLHDHVSARIAQLERFKIISKELLALEGTVLDLS